MISKSKVLITLTALFIDEYGIHYSVTDDQATLKGISSVPGHLESGFFTVVKELIQGNPTYQKSPYDFLSDDWAENMVRFAIDPELISSMINEYQENAEGADIVKLNEYFINLFDKVNCNNTVSDAVGIAHLVKGIQSGKLQIWDESNPITKLVDVMLKRDAWNVDNQGVKIIEGKLTEFGEDIEFNVCSAVGNSFVEGKIGKLGVRIFKAQNVQVYIGWGTFFPKLPEVFQVTEEEKIIQRLYDAVEISANTPA